MICLQAGLRILLHKHLREAVPPLALRTTTIMERSTTKTREELEQRIRSLTSILHKFTLQKSPSRQRKDIAPFLHHFTTLLTCGSKYDKEAKKVVAVAGSVFQNLQARALIVTQNPYSKSPVKSIRLTTVEKDDRPFKEVVTGYCPKVGLG